MGIFRRRRREADVAAGTQAVEGQVEASDLPAAEQPAPSSQRDDGPFDAGEQPPEADRLDLGSLQVPPVEGLQLQLELDEATGSVTAVRLLLGGSSAQLQAFAAPRRTALWPQITAEITNSVHDQSGSVEVVDGPFGPALLARIPASAPPLRFLGVDGPRWLLRAVLSGPAATDAAAAAPLIGLVKGTVVVRGADARAPRELLPLRLPDVEPAPAEPADGTGGAAPLDPYERGPEITEVR